MVKIKEENVNIQNWQHQKDKYIITFKISNLKPQIRKRILKRQKSGFLKQLGANIKEITEVEGDLIVKEYYKNEDIEIYKSLIPFAQKGIIPERLDPEKVEIEEDLCMIEQDLKFRVYYAGKSIDELKLNLANL